MISLFFVFFFFLFAHETNNAMQQLQAPQELFSVDTPEGCEKSREAYFRNLTRTRPYGQAMVNEFRKLEAEKALMLGVGLDRNFGELLRQKKSVQHPHIFQLFKKYEAEELQKGNIIPMQGEERTALEELCRTFCIDPASIGLYWYKKVKTGAGDGELDLTAGINQIYSTPSFELFRQYPLLFTSTAAHEFGHILLQHTTENATIPYYLDAIKRLRGHRHAYSLRKAVVKQIYEKQADLMGAVDPQLTLSQISYFKRLSQDPKQIACEKNDKYPVHPTIKERIEFLGKLYDLQTRLPFLKQIALKGLNRGAVAGSKQPQAMLALTAANSQTPAVETVRTPTVEEVD